MTVAVVGLVAASAVLGSLTLRPAAGDPPAGQGNRAGQVNFFLLPTGACFQYPAHGGLTGQQATYVTRSPCQAPHNAQIYAHFPARGAAGYPGRTVLMRQGRRDCQSGLAARLDQAKMTRQMTLVDVVPLPGSWFVHQRSISCVVVTSGPGLRTSLLNSRAARLTRAGQARRPGARAALVGASCPHDL